MTNTLAREIESIQVFRGRIVRVPEYAPCNRPAGPLTPYGQMSHQDRNSGPAARP